MLSDDVARFVAVKRRVGRKFGEQAQMLNQYARYAEAQGDRWTLVSRIHEWCKAASSPLRARTRFDAVRRLCVFLNAEDSRHEVPPEGTFGRGKRSRSTPHLLDPNQIRVIMAAALDLPPKGSISPYTYHYLFGLLAATGLRISEALALQRSDFTEDGLIVRNGKGGKSRLLPIHTTTRQALLDYLAVRNKFGADGEDLFVIQKGRAPSKVRAHVLFVQLARHLGFRRPDRTPGPRLHDLRHSFAVRSLEACPHDAQAVRHHMAALSTYLGHTDIAHTYWYLEATPVLMTNIAAASERLFREKVA